MVELYRKYIQNILELGPRSKARHFFQVDSKTQPRSVKIKNKNRKRKGAGTKRKISKRRKKGAQQEENNLQNKKSGPANKQRK